MIGVSVINQSPVYPCPIQGTPVKFIDPMAHSAIATHPRDSRDPKITRSIVTIGTPIPRDYRKHSNLNDNKRDL